MLAIELREIHQREEHLVMRAGRADVAQSDACGRLVGRRI